MNNALRAPLLRIARALGLFRLARALTRGDLRILCYHGAALADESEFSPGLFMTGATFEARMDYLAGAGFPVLTLDDALARLANGTLPDGATVITIDDGWRGTASIMAPILERHGFPATFYVATYYVAKQTQVFNVAVAYVLWKARARRLDLAAIDPLLDGQHDLGVEAERQRARDALVAYADRLDGAQARQTCLEAVCAQLGVDSSAMRERGMFMFASADLLRELPRQGIALQLHTHRHRFPADDDAASRAEIDDNRRALAPLATAALRHFCYPSGVYAASQWPLLSSCGIESATTTRRGFARRAHHRYELPRLLDSERVTPLEFEAEMSGFGELVRRGVGMVSGHARVARA